MIKTTVVVATLAAGLLLTPGTASAGICDNAGNMYITACAKGGGGTGFYYVVDNAGQIHRMVKPPQSHYGLPGTHPGTGHES